ncbi:MAG TPA: NAD(P)/FAD-dependent oxidoreductase [Jatrophihabitans sp.]|jgi:NADH dehydrogenase|uniref:NAD(P)/FAD-dependent oxidoreductase n=1 Tax=Jatrophihabitans sp. TaxID=1932789 RepID=UPI002E03F1CE|nr:NAD(P)/FAD-dependent oxidoreductase [Jatrophihabitans sp.]
MDTKIAQRHHVVVIGSGFGGLFAAKRLRRANVDVTLISKTTHHLFQPLLYQVATGILSEGEIAPATREILRRHRDVQVLLGEVTGIDLAARTVASQAGGVVTTTPYDSLIVAAGASSSYFGNDEFATFAPGLKSIDDALEIRGRILSAYEFAELEQDPKAREEWLTFAVVGAGATGVEMAGQISELARRTLVKDYRSIDTRKTRIVLVDALDTVLGAFGTKLSAGAASQLEKLGIEVWLDEKVVAVDDRSLTVEDRTGARVRIPARTVVWAAGVKGSPLANSLAEQSGAEMDRGNRIKVQPDCTLPGHPEVFVIGDMMSLNDYPGVAQVAMQQGKYAADAIRRRLRGKPAPKPFHYFDKGSMATISRFRAVANIGKLRFGGFIAWLLWLAIHVLYLVGFKNRVTTVLHWAVSFIGRGRSQRITTSQQLVARNAVQQLDVPDDAAPAQVENAEPVRSA